MQHYQQEHMAILNFVAYLKIELNSAVLTIYLYDFIDILPTTANEA